MQEVKRKIKNYGHNINIIDNHNIEEKVFNFMLITFFGLVFLYILFLGKTFWNIVERKNFEKNIHILLTEVSDQELKYLALSNSVDLEMSKSMGFTEMKPTFAVKKTFGLISTNKTLKDF